MQIEQRHHVTIARSTESNGEHSTESKRVKSHPYGVVREEDHNGPRDDGKKVEYAGHAELETDSQHPRHEGNRSGTTSTREKQNLPRAHHEESVGRGEGHQELHHTQK